VTITAAAEVRRLRNARKMSAQRLSEACEEAGVIIPRSVLANLESGRRPTISLAELLAIAAVLEVNPIDLVVPAHARDGEPFNITPNITTTVAKARAWIAGQGFLNPPATTEEFADAIRPLPNERAKVLARAWAQT
jgi:transcriptional regulator with XRE-family HTH domain